MIPREDARRLLTAYAASRIEHLLAGGTDMGGPLIFLGDEETPLRHMGNLKSPDDGRSAYHIARAVHEAVEALDATNLTVLMYAYKIIQGVKYHGFMLYHVDADGGTHTRILDPATGHQWILDGSAYWKPFPYTFGEGPHDMPAILGRHEDPVQAADFDEYLRP
jgi:hypothetical protein